MVFFMDKAVTKAIEHAEKALHSTFFQRILSSRGVNFVQQKTFTSLILTSAALSILYSLGDAADDGEFTLSTDNPNHVRQVLRSPFYRVHSVTHQIQVTFNTNSFEYRRPDPLYLRTLLVAHKDADRLYAQKNGKQQPSTLDPSLLITLDNPESTKKVFIREMHSQVGSWLDHLIPSFLDYSWRFPMLTPYFQQHRFLQPMKETFVKYREISYEQVKKGFGMNPELVQTYQKLSLENVQDAEKTPLSPENMNNKYTIYLREGVHPGPVSTEAALVKAESETRTVASFADWEVKLGDLATPTFAEYDFVFLLGPIKVIVRDTKMFKKVYPSNPSDVDTTPPSKARWGFLFPTEAVILRPELFRRSMPFHNMVTSHLPEGGSYIMMDENRVHDAKKTWTIEYSRTFFGTMFSFLLSEQKGGGSSGGGDKSADGKSSGNSSSSIPELAAKLL